MNFVYSFNNFIIKYRKPERRKDVKHNSRKGLGNRKHMKWLGKMITETNNLKKIKGNC